ncbi:hypothetical protein ACEWAO_19585 [Vibrio parahaemolyticus]|uniref:hypothetical protein n=2 Tax=Vibrio parahaemolyticus TaxID=670 RepID=UPI00193E9241|nr:hypothetical protein [Vibrio parahaemolyticus]BDP35023.1 hypothetical protein VA208B3_13940 [Vibrio alginolyticus]MBM5000881.1 hypothetical protein [Vibrio parahaemolyticus]MBO0195707.1 hypothetical protein [Vibrio parahaemolyticus]MCR9696509.1 hypothetical protein [Vibrio parahaemolyticus]MCR9762769.1 hypothetical protein [Vibrio parahaemolyticus]
MIKDLRAQKNLKLYIDLLEEVKSRVEFVSSSLESSADRFKIETNALQVRKVIELIAFALLSLHQSEYQKFRENSGRDFSKDWNGRDIITNVMKLNPDMFFRTSKGFVVQEDGTKQIQLENLKNCYTLKQLTNLYKRCGGVLHVANPWSTSNKVNSFQAELPSIIHKLRYTLNEHVVLVNHWRESESTAVIFTMGCSNIKPSYALATSLGNFQFSAA